MLSKSCDYYVYEALFCMILQMSVYYNKNKDWSLFKREIYLDDTENTVKPVPEVTCIKRSLFSCPATENII